METKTAPNGASTAAAEASPGNLSTRQLAVSLTKTAPAATAKDGTEAGAGKSAESKEPAKRGKGTSREPSPASNGKAQAEPAAEKEVNAEAAETAETQETESTAENAENAESTETETAEGAETETAEGQETETENAEESEANAGTEHDAAGQETRAPGLPAELQEAIEIAKAQDGGRGKAQLLKRLHKVVDERDTHRNQRLQLEEQNRQLASKVEELSKGDRSAPANGSSPAHPAVTAVNQELANVDHWRNWCAENPEGGEVPDGKGGKLSIDAATVKRLGRQLEDQRTELVTRKVQTERDVQAAWNAEYTKHHQVAVEKHPWLKNQNSPEYQEMQTILKAFPAIKASPDYERVLGWMFKGRALEQAEASAKKNGAGLRKAAPSREPTKVPTSPPGGAASPKKPTERKAEEAESAFKSSGSTKDLARMFAGRARARAA